jgi:hypothetical protein
MESKLDLIASILNLTHLKNDDGKYPFKIINEYETLNLIHYDSNTISKTASDSEIRKLRGIIIDTEEKKVVCPSFGCTPTIISNVLPEPKSIVKDSHNIEYTFPETFKISPVTEGTMIRVWKYKNELLFSTHKRINCENSKWGSSGFFKKLFMDYIKDYNLESMVTDGKIANFILMDKNLTIATKFPFNNRDGLVVFLGVTDIENTTFENTVTLPTFNEYNNQDITFFKSWEMNTEEANKHLTQGFYDFPAREQTDILCLSEGVVVSYIENGKNCVMIVNSEAYSRRIKLVDNDPNILHRCYKLINKTYYPKNSTEVDTYLNNYPAVPVMNDEEIKNLNSEIISELPGKICTSEELTNKNDKKSYELRLRNALTWYAMSVSLPRQAAAFQSISTLIKERSQIVEIMSKKYYNFLKGDFDEYNHNIHYPEVFKYIQHRIVNARDFAKTNSVTNKPNMSLILNNIKTGVMRDSGDWLYNIAKVLIRIPNKTCNDEICIPTQQIRFAN